MQRIVALFIALVIIEHDHGGVQSEQLQNRVNAFVEMVRP
jgi:benzoyl-CoA reductase/2-hydroxyglutaryl-CoA dehydratase subunit BcrC/BadD/HgdB